MGENAKSPAVLELLRSDRWALAEVATSIGPGLIRFRTPVLSGRRRPGYGRALKVVWAYAAEGSGALPSDGDSARMSDFEDRLCEVVEHDAQAVLVAILIFDGARQWVFYTDDAREFLVRLDRAARVDRRAASGLS